MGANGAGKSTLLKTAFGVIKTMGGEIYLDGKKSHPTPQILVKNGICFIPQKNRVFPEMSVMENLELATHSWADRSLFPQYLDDVLEYFPDLRAKLSDPAGSLSGGQQQMVALARGLISKPKMILPSDDEALVAVTLNRKYAAFVVDNYLMRIRLPEGTYPPYEKVIPKSVDFTAKVNRLELKGALERMGLIAKDTEYNNVRLMIERGTLTLSAQADGAKSAAEEYVGIEGGEPLDISFNIAYLTDYVNRADGNVLTISFNDKYSPSLT